MEKVMLTYYRQHPEAQGVLVKTAASNALTRFFLGLGRKIPSLKNLGAQTRQFAKDHALGIAGVATGTAAGAWLGNQAYNNAIPPVKMLPDIEQLPQIGVWQPDQNWQRLSEYADY